MASPTEDTPDIVISTFLEYIRSFQYDKAKDLVDRQREMAKNMGQSMHSIWPTILAALSQLAVAEKSYASFLYLSPKWFGRRDARSLYENVATECKKIDQLGMRLTSELPALAHVCGQLVPYVTVKTEMIDFFSTLHAMTSVKFSDRSDLLMKIHNVMKDSNDKFYHPQLEPMKTAFITECEVIEKLLQADISMSRWDYVESLLHLQNAQSKITLLMNSTSSITSNRALVKLNFLGMKTPTVPVLYTWLKQFKDAIYSKFTLYFYDVLSKYAPQGDMKTYISRCSQDYYTKLVTFHRRTDAHLIALILNSEGAEVKGVGYSLLSSSPRTLQGIQGYIAIFCYPNEFVALGDNSQLPCLPAQQQTSLVMIMSCNDKKLNTSDKPVDFYDVKDNSTYIVSRIDPSVSLVALYRSKKSDREKKGILSFIQEVSCLMRYTKLFSELRPS